MKPDEPPPGGQPNPDTPPASLAAVRVVRRKAAAPIGKAGDLTQQLGAGPTPAPASAAPPTPTEAPRAAAPPQPPAPAAPRAAEAPRTVAPRPRAEPPPAAAPPTAKPQPAARLLGEEEIRQLLDPPERRAAPKPTPAAAAVPAAPAPPPQPPRAAAPPTPPAPPPQPPRAAAPPPVPAPAPQPPRAAAPPPAPAPVPQPPRAVAPPPPPAPAPAVEPDEPKAMPLAAPPPELRIVAETPAAAPAAEPVPIAAAPPSSIDQIIDYWDGLRDGKPFPPLEALDRSHVSRTWPNCMLVAYGATDTVAPKLTRIGEENGEIEYLEMVIHWILSRGQLAARRGEPMEEEKRFPVTDGNARYQLLLLPLATSEGKSEHVLCHLSRVKEAVKPKRGGFKRWLAS